MITVIMNHFLRSTLIPMAFQPLLYGGFPEEVPAWEYDRILQMERVVVPDNSEIHS